MQISNEDFFTHLALPALKAGHSVEMRVKGHSMAPLLPDGTLITVVPPPSRLKIGEVVLASWRGRIILHRIVWQNKRLCWLAGDNNVWQLERVNKADIVGMVIQVNTTQRTRTLHADTYLGLLWFILRPARFFLGLLKKKSH